LRTKGKIVFSLLVFIILLDQISKFIVDRTMALNHSIPVIQNLFSLTYIRNTGAAFGILAGSDAAYRLPILIVFSLLAIGFTGAFRRSELVAINIEHLIFEEEGVVVFVPRSKTDQEGVGRHVGIPYAAQDPCPVRLLRTWIARLNHCGITEGPVFRRVHRARDGHTLGDGLALGDKALTGESAAEVVKKYAQMIGKDPTQFGGHSLRSGFATQSIMDEVPEAEIMRQTGHKSVVVFREYVRRASVFQGNAAKGIWK